MVSRRRAAGVLQGLTHDLKCDGAAENEVVMTLLTSARLHNNKAVVVKSAARRGPTPAENASPYDPCSLLIRAYVQTTNPAIQSRCLSMIESNGTQSLLGPRVAWSWSKRLPLPDLQDDLMKPVARLSKINCVWRSDSVDHFIPNSAKALDFTFHVRRNNRRAFEEPK